MNKKYKILCLCLIWAFKRTYELVGQAPLQALEHCDPISFSQNCVKSQEVKPFKMYYCPKEMPNKPKEIRLCFFWTEFDLSSF